MTISKSCTTDIMSLLENGNKIYLSKNHNGENTQHVFYQTKDECGNHFYHIRYTISDKNKISNLRDFPVRSILPNRQNEVNEQIRIFTNKILDFVKRNNYTISCDRKV